MATVPAPSHPIAREEWPDADFELNDDDPLHTLAAESDKDEDWDLEMDLGNTGGARAHAVLPIIPPHPQSPARRSPVVSIRPPMAHTLEEEDEEEEGFSTIKMATLRPLSGADQKPDQAPVTATSTSPTLPADDDFESAFSLPSDLTQLSLRPLSHQSSKNSLEWVDRDQTSSSQSSDAYSLLGFDHGSISSNSTRAETELEDFDEEDLDGLVLPSNIFDAASGAKQLTKLLELKKTTLVHSNGPRSANTNPEDDFESGLVIGDDTDFSPSRLLQTQQMLTSRCSPVTSRSKSLPTRPPVARPPSRIRTKSPTIGPPPSSQRQLQRINRLSPSPPPRVAPTRSQSALLAPPSKPGSLRGQKSHAVLTPSSSSSSQHRLSRKASLPSLMDNSQPVGMGAAIHSSRSQQGSGYNAPTAASRAKTQGSASGRMRSLDIPPTRPSTPSSSGALRLTMPTNSSRLKSRPSISSVFPRATSPQPARPPSSLSLRSRATPTQPTPGPSSIPSGPKVLRKPKRVRAYGDGTELDSLDDLPTDRDRENEYRVQPKGYGNRTNASSGSPKKSTSNDSGRGTIRRKSKLNLANSGSGPEATSRTLKRSGRMESAGAPSESMSKHKKATSSGHTRRKPTLIRNLGGVGGPKVVGEMKWNPHTLRWEGNDQALRDFDAAMAPTRPALITHLTGSSIGSPVNNFSSGARRVGNMIFDPAKMCWISTLAPEDEEPDVFADLADDEGEWDTHGNTFRLSKSAAPSVTSGTSGEPPSPARSRVCSPSGSDSDRGSRASMVCDVDDSFLDDCRAAEERHRTEMKGWRGKLRDSLTSLDRPYLYEIRALATRTY